MFYNEFFNTGLPSYTASIARVETNEREAGVRAAAGNDENGIRVVRELRVGSDDDDDQPVQPVQLVPWVGVHHHPASCQDWQSRDNPYAGGYRVGLRSPDLEGNLDDFEFPDYKHRMNAPI